MHFSRGMSNSIDSTIELDGELNIKETTTTTTTTTDNQMKQSPLNFE